MSTLTWCLILVGGNPTRDNRTTDGSAPKSKISIIGLTIAVLHCGLIFYTDYIDNADVDNNPEVYRLENNILRANLFMKRIVACSMPPLLAFSIIYRFNCFISLLSSLDEFDDYLVACGVSKEIIYKKLRLVDFILGACIILLTIFNISMAPLQIHSIYGTESLMYEYYVLAYPISNFVTHCLFASYHLYAISIRTKLMNDFLNELLQKCSSWSKEKTLTELVAYRLGGAF